MERKTIFLGAYGLSRTGIVECSEIVDVGCNLKQFDVLTWLTPTNPHFLCFTTDLHHWTKRVQSVSAGEAVI